MVKNHELVLTVPNIPQGTAPDILIQSELGPDIDLDGELAERNRVIISIVNEYGYDPVATQIAGQFVTAKKTQKTR